VSKLIKSLLLAMLMIMFVCTLVNAHEYVVLTQDNSNATVLSGESVTIYGTLDANQITVESGVDVELVNFAGSNTVGIESDSAGFTVSRSGATVTFQGPDGTRLRIPATRTAQIIDFTDRPSLTLSIYNGQVMLDDQVITTTAVSIDSSSEVIDECGAYVAPGVWKKFDCYNLAAIGKTTGDDPFTPSWRLIGGYWQWGRKGPNSSQWYDTNTSNFAHGPTGFEWSEANDDDINGGDTNAPDGSWSDASKTANDPCSDGYRIPTESQWQGVIDNNTQSLVGTWSNSSINYSAAIFFGDDLMLPAAGYRTPTPYGRSLIGRGYVGVYWSSTSFYWPDTENDALNLDFRNVFGIMGSVTVSERTIGLSVRCIAEEFNHIDN